VTTSTDPVSGTANEPVQRCPVCGEPVGVVRMPPDSDGHVTYVQLDGQECDRCYLAADGAFRRGQDR
jgi:hypothetical protein